MEDSVIPPQLETTSRRTYRILNTFFALCVCAIAGYYTLSAPPVENNSREVTIHISSHDTITSVSNNLETRNVVRYGTILKFLTIIFNQDQKLAIGDYRFMKGAPVWSIAWQIARAHHNVIPIKITLREGITNAQITDILAQNISAFRRDLFISDERYRQGYLFPDTYFFFPMSTTDEILDELSTNLKKRLAPIKKDIEASKYSLDQILVIASIVEKEAQGETDAPVIAGILWKRFRLGMPLQADVAPETYKSIGLPKEPIGNPGLVSIHASVYPTESAYLYYLHDKKGQVHYAKTYDEHKRNISLYLR